MGWDYSADLVYGVRVDLSGAPEAEDDPDNYLWKVSREYGCKYSYISFYGEEQWFFVHDAGMSVSAGYGANEVEIPTPVEPSDALQEACKSLGIECAPRWYMGVSVS
jgi:hypothetical protein